jgi:ABC-type multidrug transport system fused ATPase/permease subunit
MGQGHRGRRRGVSFMETNWRHFNCSNTHHRSLLLWAIVDLQIHGKQTGQVVTEYQMPNRLLTNFRWVKAVQRRVAICSSILRSMKSVKLSGLVDSMAELVQSERVRELRMAKQFRGLSVAVNMTSNLPTVFSALVSFAAYSIKANIAHTAPLTTAQAFTSFAILTLLTAPASQLLSAIPMLTAGMGCVRRVHAFISSEPFDDSREITGAPDHDSQFEEKERPGFRDPEKSSQDSESPALSISNLVLKSSHTSENVVPPTISLEVGRGTLTTILGPVGCGKSTLLRSVLGEIKPSSGSVAVSTPFIAYCAQSPWLPNGRIRDLILGANAFDAAWYDKIITLCDLESDFSQMPDNDLTVVGSRGIVLSGGQKHRVVRARPCSVLHAEWSSVSPGHCILAALSSFLMISLAVLIARRETLLQRVCSPKMGMFNSTVAPCCSPRIQVSLHGQVRSC